MKVFRILVLGNWNKTIAKLKVNMKIIRSLLIAAATCGFVWHVCASTCQGSCDGQSVSGPSGCGCDQSPAHSCNVNCAVNPPTATC